MIRSGWLPKKTEDAVAMAEFAPRHEKGPFQAKPKLHQCQSVQKRCIQEVCIVQSLSSFQFLLQNTPIGVTIAELGNRRYARFHGHNLLRFLLLSVIRRTLCSRRQSRTMPCRTSRRGRFRASQISGALSLPFRLSCASTGRRLSIRTTKNGDYILSIFQDRC